MATAPIAAFLRLQRSAVDLTIPDGTIVTDHISATAGQEIVAEKLRHLHKVGTNFGLATTGTPVTTTRLIFVASASGTINKFAATLYDMGTSTDVDFILLKNGASISGSPINFTEADPDRTIREGTLSSSTFVVNDVFHVICTATASTGATGPFCWAEFNETVG